MEKQVQCSRYQYKCRKCGEIFSSPFYLKTDEIFVRCTNALMTDEQLDWVKRAFTRAGWNKNDPSYFKRPDMMGSHRCSDGGGIGDLVGWEKPIMLPVRRKRIIQPQKESAKGGS